MSKGTISFRLDSEKLAELDALANATDRNRTYLLNEAVTTYLDVQQWQLEQIKAGIAEADAGKLMPHAKVKSMAAKWRRRK